MEIHGDGESLNLLFICLLPEQSSHSNPLQCAHAPFRGGFTFLRSSSAPLERLYLWFIISESEAETREQWCISKMELWVTYVWWNTNMLLVSWTSRTKNKMIWRILEQKHCRVWNTLWALLFIVTHSFLFIYFQSLYPYSPNLHSPLSFQLLRIFRSPQSTLFFGSFQGLIFPLKS